MFYTFFDNHLLLGILATLCFTLLAGFSGKIDWPGAIVGGGIAFSIFLGAGFGGMFLLGLFFVLGSAASQIGIDKKEELGLAEENKGKRSIANAMANGGAAAICGLIGWLLPAHEQLLQVMLASSLASATSDTLSSELGNLFGKRYFNITNGKRWERGKDGAISLEGTLAGFAGSLAIGIAYGLGFEWGIGILFVTFAGLLGNLSDSWIGATLQNAGKLDNHGTNFISTLLAACYGGLFLFSLTG